MSEHTARDIKISVITKRGRYLYLPGYDCGESAYLLDDSIFEALVFKCNGKTSFLNVREEIHHP